MPGLNRPMTSSARSHSRKHSAELGVFEATRYFSGATDVESISRRPMRVERKSLDMPNIEYQAKDQQRIGVINQIKDKIKNRQPSSPGAKLASFLNSLFQQYHSTSKKKKASKSVKSDQVERTSSSTERRKRSSSISQSKGISNYESKSCYYHSSCSSTTGFRAPSLPSKKIPEFRDEVYGDEFGLPMRLGDDQLNIKKKEIKDAEDGGESDSSSDLFELKNYDFGDLSNDLPVYGSTDMGVIRRGAGFASTVACYDLL